MEPTSAILLMHCPDQSGIIAAVSDFIFKNGGNILALEQHVDQQGANFFMRAQWDLSRFQIPTEKLNEFFFHLVGKPFQAKFQIQVTGTKPKMALMVSKEPHCLLDILSRWVANDLAVEIPLVISNHEVLRPHVERVGIPFYHVPLNQGKAQAETEAQRLMQAAKVDFVVLARYMQILSEDFVAPWPNQIINIHHSFLPAFTGARPYHSAFERGVKIIGASSHYVTANLDEGPIIEQDVVRVSHIDQVHDLVQKGKDLEKVVLARAIQKHLDFKTLVFENRTLVFA